MLISFSLSSSTITISFFFIFFLMNRQPPRSTLFPYPTLFRSACVDQFVYHFLHRVDFHDAPALHAVLGAGARPQEPQEIVDLRGRADGRAAARRRVLLLDGDCRRDALDPVD